MERILSLQSTHVGGHRHERRLGLPLERVFSMGGYWPYQ